MSEQHPPEPSRMEEIRQIHRDYRLFYQILGGIILVGIGVLIGAILFSDDDGYVVNVYTEILSIGITVLFIDRLYRYREEKNAEKRLKEQLIRDAASISNEIAKNAIYQIRRHNKQWLIGENGILKGANLEYANLSGADLREANLQDAILHNANLESALFSRANLQNAFIPFSNLRGAALDTTKCTNADMIHINLSQARILGVDFSGARLEQANFREAKIFGRNDFRGANLYLADFQDSTLGQKMQIPGIQIEVDPSRFMPVFDTNTILPDGSNWRKGRDLREFTDPEGWQRDQNP